MKLRNANLHNVDDLNIIINSCTKVKQKCIEQWTELEVLNSLINGTSFALIGEENDALIFYIKGNIFWIWIAHSKHIDAIGYYMDDIKQIAMELKCDNVSWNSTRPGYKKLLNKLNAKISRIEYSITIGDQCEK
jgi:hypothetical protein